MKGPVAAAVAVIITLVVVLANLLGLVAVPAEGYAGLALLMAGFAAVGWSEDDHA